MKQELLCQPYKQEIEKNLNFVGIYKILNIVNNKIYIGSSVEINKRWIRHRRQLNLKKHYNKHLQNAWDLYGEKNFLFEIIENTILNKDIIEEREKYWIDFYKSSDHDHGYNLYHSPRGPINYKYSNEIIERRKERFKKNGHPWSGKKHSDDTKEKMSLAQKGKIFSEEHRKKISNYRKNHKISEETKVKISINTSGEKNPRALLKEEDVLKIKQLYKEGMKVSKISKMYNMSWSAIDRVVKGKSWSKIKNVS